MSYNIQIEHKENHLFAKVDGEASLESALEMWDLLREKCDELELHMVIVLYRVAGQLDTIDVFKIAEHIAETYRFGHPIIAFVDPRLDYAQLHRFGEDVLFNRGVKGKAFLNVLEAEKWLAKR